MNPIYNFKVDPNEWNWDRQKSLSLNTSATIVAKRERFTRYYIALQLSHHTYMRETEWSDEYVSLMIRFKPEHVRSRHWWGLRTKPVVAFMADPILATKQAIFHTEPAALFALIVFVCDGYLQPTRKIHIWQARFLAMTNRLPIELQMLICNLAEGENRDVIPSNEFEPAARALAALCNHISAHKLGKISWRQPNKDWLFVGAVFVSLCVLIGALKNTASCG
jgi:hypothetical protein